MDLVTACPFRSLMALFALVPLGVIAGIYAAEASAGLKRQGWRIRHH